MRALPQDQAGRTRQPAGQEAGALSLVEVVVVLALLGLLLGIVLPVVSTFGQATRAITASFDTADQLEGPAATVTRLLTEAVAPAPPGDPAGWWAVFTQNTSATELQFTADVGLPGQEYQQGDPASTIAGPALVTVQLQNGPASSGGAHLLGELQLAQAGTCPTASSPNTNPPASSCQWSAQPQILFDLTHLQLGSQPLFEFLLAGSSDLTPQVSTGCTGTAAGACPLDEIQAVALNLRLAPPGAPPTAYQSEVWLAAPNYDPLLG